MAADATRTLLFGIFVLANRPLTASQIVALSKPLGISATNVKSHLTRLVAEGSLDRSGPRRRARYSPAIDQRGLVAGIAARLDSHSEAWDGRWIMLVLHGPSNRSQRRALGQSLWFDGFRPSGADTYLRPAWPERWALERARAYLAERSGLCVHGTLVGTLDLRRVARMYDLDVLDREARRLARTISAKSRGNGSAAEAFAARLDVGGRVARLVAHDPRLPQGIWASRTGLRDLLRAYRRFEGHIGPAAQRFLHEVLEPRQPRQTESR